MSILIVEDERAICDYWKRALEAEGYTVKVSRSTKSAISRITEVGNSIRLVILDIMMYWEPFEKEATNTGRITGLLAYNQYLANDDGTSIVPVIVITAAHDDLYEQIQTHFNGTDVVVENKPISLDRLVELVNEHHPD